MDIKITGNTGVDTHLVLTTINELIEAGLPGGILVDLNGNRLGEWGD